MQHLDFFLAPISGWQMPRCLSRETAMVMQMEPVRDMFMIGQVILQITSPGAQQEKARQPRRALQLRIKKRSKRARAIKSLQKTFFLRSLVQDEAAANEAKYCYGDQGDSARPEELCSRVPSHSSRGRCSPWDQDSTAVQRGSLPTGAQTGRSSTTQNLF